MRYIMQITQQSLIVLPSIYLDNDGEIFFLRKRLTNLSCCKFKVLCLPNKLIKNNL